MAQVDKTGPAMSLNPAGPDEIELLGASEDKDYDWLIQLVSIVTILGLWEIGGRLLGPRLFSYPTEVVQSAFQMTATGELLIGLLQSGKVLLSGFLVAGVAGVLIGMLMGRYRLFDAGTGWFVTSLYATPLIAVTPLVIMWFGLGFPAKLFIVFIMGVFPVIINTAAGVRNVPETLLDVGRAFAASEREVFVKLILPSALPFIMIGLRLAIGRCIIGMIVAEFYTSIGGLGALIIKYGSLYDTGSMFVPLILLAVLAILLTSLLRRLELYIAPWKP